MCHKKQNEETKEKGKVGKEKNESYEKGLEKNWCPFSAFWILFVLHNDGMVCIH